jgi:hypothetical protein
MNLCDQCGAPLDDAGFTNCGGKGEELCRRDRAAFEREVDEAKKSIDLQVLALMEQNKMPACFEPTRAATVAMSRLLMDALRQNQQLAEAMREMYETAVRH